MDKQINEKQIMGYICPEKYQPHYITDFRHFLIITTRSHCKKTNNIFQFESVTDEIQGTNEVLMLLDEIIFHKMSRFWK